MWPPSRAADRDRDVLRAQRRGVGLPLAEDAEPPDEVAPAVASRRPVVRADREVDPAARALQLVGDLHTGRPGADDEDGAVGQLPRVAVGAGVELQRARRRRGRPGGSPAAGTGRSRPRRSARRWSRPTSRPGSRAGRRSCARTSPRRRSGSAPRSSPRRRRSSPRPAPSTAKPSGSRSANSSPGNRSCQAGPFATRESQRSERQRSAMRCRSSTRCGTPYPFRCSLIATPAWPAPTTRTSICWLGIQPPTPIRVVLRVWEHGQQISNSRC